MCDDVSVEEVEAMDVFHREEVIETEGRIKNFFKRIFGMDGEEDEDEQAGCVALNWFAQIFFGRIFKIGFLIFKV